MIDFFKKKSKPRDPGDTTFKESEVPTPEEFQSMPPLDESQRSAILAQMSKREIFESIMISETASFILRGIEPSTRTPEVMGAVTSATAKFVLNLIGRLEVRSNFTREQLAEVLESKAQICSNHVSLDRDDHAPSDQDPAEAAPSGTAVTAGKAGLRRDFDA